MSASVSSSATSHPIDISVLVPVMNEAGNIIPLVDEICTAFKGRRFEIIYIDDASTDGTAAELSDLLKTVPQLRVLRHEIRSGQSAALWSGLWQARGVLIGVLDGDGQNVPADFPAIDSALQNLGDTPGMVAGMLLHFTLFAGVVPNLARIHVAEAVAERLHSAANPATAIAAAGFHEPSLVFLLGRDLLLVDSREAALFLAEAPNGVALVEARQQTAFLDMARRLNLSLAAPQQVSGYNMSKGQDVVILIYRREIFDANSDTE